MPSNTVRDIFYTVLINADPSFQKYDYSFFSQDGVDHRLIALYCVQRITKGFSRAKYTSTRGWEEKFQSFVSTVIFRSHLGIGVAIAALTLAERMQSALLVKEHNFVTTIDDARRVFLVSYMIAAKIMFDNEYSLVWWKRVIDREYDCSDLAKMEVKFYETVAWDVKINEGEFLRCFKETMTWYQHFIEEHTLPASPLPTYQPARERRLPLAARYLSAELEGGQTIPMVDEEDEIRFSSMLGLPLPCTTTVRRAYWRGMISGLSRRVF